MAKKSTIAKRGGGSGPLVKLLLQIVAAVAVLYGFFWWRLNARVDAAFDQIKMVAPASHGRASFSLNGDIHIARVNIQSQSSPQGKVGLRAERVTLHTPGLMWLLKVSFLSLEGREPDRFGVTLTNFEVDAPQVSQSGSAVAPYSGALFEAEGCGTTAFTRSSFQQLGLVKADSIATVKYRALGNDSAEFIVGMGTPGLGAMDIVITITAPGMERNKMAAAMGVLSAAQITFRDEGFIAARNTWCAGQSKISTAQFIEQHMQAVRATLAKAGLQADAALETVYRDYATKGGELTIQARPTGAFSLADLGRYRFEDLRQLLSPIVTLQGHDPVLLALSPLTATAVVADPAVVANGATPVPAAAPVAGAAPASQTSVVNAPSVQESAPLVAYGGSQTGDVAATESNEYAQLRQAVGHEVVIRTTNGTTRRGTLLRFSNANLDLQLGPREGGILLSIPRDSVRDVGIVVATAAPAPADEGSPDAKKK